MTKPDFEQRHPQDPNPGVHEGSGPIGETYEEFFERIDLESGRVRVERRRFVLRPRPGQEYKILSQEDSNRFGVDAMGQQMGFGTEHVDHEE